jgi:hypothetical protein
MIPVKLCMISLWKGNPLDGLTGIGAYGCEKTATALRVSRLAEGSPKADEVEVE